jgi:hypothetical protein
MFIWDKQNHDYNTEKSERELYRYYKNLDKIVDQNNVNLFNLEGDSTSVQICLFRNAIPHELALPA